MPGPQQGCTREGVCMPGCSGSPGTSPRTPSSSQRPRPEALPLLGGGGSSSLMPHPAPHTQQMWISASRARGESPRLRPRPRCPCPDPPPRGKSWRSLGPPPWQPCPRGAPPVQVCCLRTCWVTDPLPPHILGPDTARTTCPLHWLLEHLSPQSAGQPGGGSRGPLGVFSGHTARCPGAHEVGRWVSLPLH